MALVQHHPHEEIEVHLRLIVTCRKKQIHMISQPATTTVLAQSTDRNETTRDDCLNDQNVALDHHGRVARKKMEQLESSNKYESIRLTEEEYEMI